MRSLFLGRIELRVIGPAQCQRPLSPPAAFCLPTLGERPRNTAGLHDWLRQRGSSGWLDLAWQPGHGRDMLAR